MGLKLRLNLFRDVGAAEVYGAYAGFYATRRKALLDSGDEYWEFVLHEQDNSWTVLELDGGWEWTARREAQRFVSKALGCVSFLIFVYDGDYWGYELVRQGMVLDQFVQDESEDTGQRWFEGPAAGNAEVVAAEFSWLKPAEVAPYLVQKDWDRWLEMERSEVHAEYERLNVPARPGDEFGRFDECAVLDFLRLLGVRVELREHFVTLAAPVWRRFWVEGQRFWHEHPSRRRSASGGRAL